MGKTPECDCSTSQIQKGLDKKIKELESRYGKEKLKEAQNLARLVYEDSDSEGVKTLLELENQYGKKTIQKAARILSQKSPDNPKRSLAYLISTIKGIGKKAPFKP